ncbi:Hsp70 family protein [Petropleomorpha daqingensis]|uniref:Actin-like ATPase involved in cell morphogenesis n=1 Tax=Petropleomorpha daqingensis TaxID=2026353 RepID=A0A853CHF9_9ACTN|nr:Hsp70 family protein [Petropleomorpha daqingensis]NYJ05483.1 actin-like ATPase involved in cell morphogenesis [Petropleomorpha daqingensis]
MSADGYGLGIDLGDATITVAACSPGDERCAEPLRLPPLPDTGCTGALLDRVGDPVPLYVDGRPRPAADAVAAVIAEVVERVAEQRGPAAATVVTVPPSWSEHRRQALDEALHGTATLVSSAVAVTRHGRATGTVPAVATVAVYDLGASTLDTAVVRADADGDLAHVAPPPAPLPWGGRDVDDAVVEHVRSFLPTTPTALRTACVAAKEALSTQTDVRVEIDGQTRPIRLVREDLDELLADAVTESVGALRAAVTGAGLEPSELDGIVLAGGGARLPAVAEALSADLGLPVLMTDEPEQAAACGAAELALDLIEAPAVPTVELAVVADEEPGDAFVEDDVPEDDEPYEDDELAGRRRRRPTGPAALSRVALVAALFVAILATPVTLLAALDSGVLASHGGGAASAADSSPAAGTTGPDSPAAATGPAGTTAAAHGTSRSAGHSTRAASPRSSSKAGTGGSTASRAAAAAASSPAAASAAAAPVDTTVATTDPGTTAAAPVTDPAPVTSDPPPVTSDPPPVTSDPPPVTSDPPPVTSDPPPVTSDPPPPPPADTPPADTAPATP